MHVIHVHVLADLAHKETAHYAAWRDAVAPMMAEPRHSTTFANVFPDDAAFSVPRGGGTR